jgi:hypothetical protein
VLEHGSPSLKLPQKVQNYDSFSFLDITFVYFRKSDDLAQYT